MPASNRRPLLRLLLAGTLLIGLLLTFTPLGSGLLSKSFSTKSTPALPSKSPQRSSEPPSPRSQLGSGFVIRKWLVPPDIGNRIVHYKPSTAGLLASEDPFAAESIFHTASPYEALRAQWVPFPPGSWVRLDPYAGTLEVKNAPDHLEMIDIVLSNLQPMKIWTIDPALFHTGEPPEKDHSPDIDWINHKLANIIIPKVDFDNVTLREAIDFLNQQSRKHDNEALDSPTQGLDIQIMEPGPSVEDPNGVLVRTSLASATISELRLRNVPVATVLQYICDARAIRYRVDPEGVALLSASSDWYEPINKKIWHVAPAVVDRLRIPPGEPWNVDADDPFAAFESMPKEEWTAQRQSLPLDYLFKEVGITFPDGASVNYDPDHSTMTINSTPWNFAIFEVLLQSVALDISRERARGIADQ
jgi:hypothetical protein